MLPNNLTLEIIRENPLPANPQHFVEVTHLVPTKEEELQKQHTETFDQTNYELVKFMSQDIKKNYQVDLTPERLIEALQKLYKVLRHFLMFYL